MKLLVIGDLHGQMPKLHFKGYDAIIAPGDFCSDAPKEYMWQSMKEKFADLKSGRHWYDIIGREKAKEMIEKSLADGRVILEYLNSLGVPVYIVPGNWDWEEKDFEREFMPRNHFADLIHGLKNIVNLHKQIVDIGDYVLIGYGISSAPEYPQTEKSLNAYSSAELQARKRGYNAITKKLDLLFSKAKKPVIFLSHNVPYDTELDMIVNRDSPKHGMHSGSLIAREIIDKYQPLLCIGGHMHEHFGSVKLGKTICINAGFGSDVNVWLEIDGGKIKKMEFYRGD